jgi:hypothetical protein
MVNCADGSRPDGGSTVFQIIAGDGSDHGVLEIHSGYGLSYAGGLTNIKFGRSTCLDSAKGAGTSADVAQNHDGGSTARPALAHVWTLGALADGMQIVVVDDLAHGFVFRAGG